MFVAILYKRHRVLFDKIYNLEQQGENVPVEYYKEIHRIVQLLYDLGEPFGY